MAVLLTKGNIEIIVVSKSARHYFKTLRACKTAPLKHKQSLKINSLHFSTLVFRLTALFAEDKTDVSTLIILDKLIC